MRLFLVNIPTLILTAIAAWLAFNGKDGWGWFLFLAVLLAHTISSKKCDCDEDDDAKV